MGKRTALQKLDKFIETLMDIRNNIETTGIITNEMKILFHYIDEYHEIEKNSDSVWNSYNFGDCDDINLDNLDDQNNDLLSYNFSDCDINSIASLDCDNLNLNNLDDQDNNNNSDTSSTSEYISDSDYINDDEKYMANIELVLNKSTIEYANYINGKLLIRNLSSQ